MPTSPPWGVPHSTLGKPSSIDSPDMRRAGRDLLSLALMDARNHSLRWLQAFEDARVAVPESLRPEVDPPLWTLGHLGWYQEYWIGRNVQRHRGEQCDERAPRLASIEPGADGWFEDRKSVV